MLLTLAAQEEDVKLSSFGELLRTESSKTKPKTVMQLLSAWMARTGADVDKTLGTATSLMLTDVAFLLWLAQCRKWQDTGLAWTSNEQITSAMAYYMKGQRLGEQPVFDGLCSQCGSLLHGHLNMPGGNKCNGPPADEHRSRCAHGAQPPFLLRWTRPTFAEMLPDVFQYDASTKKLSLKPEHQAQPPWTAPEHHRQKNPDDTWLYCDSCHDVLFSGDSKPKFHVPYRDAASVGKLHRMRPAGEAANGVAPPPPTPNPAWAALRKKWTARRQQESKVALGKFAKSNLVPKPRTELWQNTPEAPFHALNSEDARGHLSCCQLHSSMQKTGDQQRRASYVCSAGETTFWRRQPKQMSSTLAFMLHKDEGQFCKIRASEVEPLRETLMWLRENNPHFQAYWTNAERFIELYGQFQAVLPRTDGSVPVRLCRTRSMDAAVVLFHVYLLYLAKGFHSCIYVILGFRRFLSVRFP
jgi:hypothetical protein